MRATVTGRADWRRAALVAASGVVMLAVPANAQCLPFMCGFTENGKKGPYLEAEVDPQELARNDAAIKTAGAAGKMMAAESINRGEFYGAGLRMHKVEAALTALLGDIAKHWKYRQPERISVRVVGTTSFSPLAHPDGVIVIPFGMLQRATSDDQIVWLLAHEFSHLALAHFAREARMKKTKRTLSGLLAVTQAGLELSQHRIEHSGDQLRLVGKPDPGRIAMADRLALHSGDLRIALALTNAFFSRKQEDQADVLGIDLALAAGYSEGAASEAMMILAEDEAARTSFFESLGKDVAKVSGEQATKALARSAEKNDFSKLGDDLLKSIGANVAQLVLNKLADAYSATHRPTDKRRKGVADYYDRAHPGRPRVKPRTTWLTAIRALPEYREAEQAVQARAKAKNLLDSGKPLDAMVALQPALATSYRTSPLIANAAAQIFDRAGQFANADAQYSIAVRYSAAAPAVTPKKRRGKAAPPPPPPPTTAAFKGVGADRWLEQSLDGFRDHVGLLVRMKNYTKALAMVEEAKRRFSDSDAFLPFLIRIYRVTNKGELMAAAVGQCSETEDDVLRNQCREAILTEQEWQKFEQMSPAEQAEVRRALVKIDSKAQSGNFLKTISEAMKPQSED